jgi:hypothetical protein
MSEKLVEAVDRELCHDRIFIIRWLIVEGQCAFAMGFIVACVYSPSWIHFGLNMGRYKTKYLMNVNVINNNFSYKIKPISASFWKNSLVYDPKQKKKKKKNSFNFVNFYLMYIRDMKITLSKQKSWEYLEIKWMEEPWLKNEVFDVISSPKTLAHWHSCCSQIF